MPSAAWAAGLPGPTGAGGREKLRAREYAQRQKGEGEQSQNSVA